ncbi:MAG TPA: beta-propeller fold lactonase family protein [Burkholderiales bacterium]|nr:beta-propeller fold lactonase family protein [Burkholderiales bacterium]
MAAKKLVTIGALVLLGSCGGGGGGGGSTAGGPAGFVYVTNETSETVSVYAIDAGTGALTPVAGSPFATGKQPLGIAADPSGKFAYVANSSPISNSVSAYTIDARSGALADIPGQVFAAGSGPASVAVGPSGKFAYVANLGGDISAYSIDAASGGLTPLAGPNVAAGVNARSIAVDPSGKFAYVANVGGGVSAYTIDPVGGALAPIDADSGTAGIQSFAAGTFPSGVAVHPSGKFAYVANFSSNDVSAYAIDPTTGVLTPVPNSPFSTGPSGVHPFGVTVHPSGKFLYVTNNGSGNVSAYTIDATTGALTAIDAIPGTVAIDNFAAGTGPQSVTVDPSGKFAYVANNASNNISAYAIDASSGALTALTNSPFAAGTGPSFVLSTGIAP